VDVSTVGEIETLLTEQETKVLLRMRYPNNHVSIEEAMRLEDYMLNSIAEAEHQKDSLLLPILNQANPKITNMISKWLLYTDKEYPL
jgi:hypothetical protein